MEIEVIRSHRRRRTISARFADGIMYIYAPVGISDEKLAEVTRNFKRRFERQKLKKELKIKENLNEVVRRLNEKYFGGKLKIESTKYAVNQHKRFGSCNHRKGTIRISYRLAKMPQWVRDYVIVHEMAHIIQPNHSKSFWDIVSRYKLAERARGYLMAKGFEPEAESDIEEVQ
ncbi:MAG: M48 family metallopeptidase [Candidatus Omnitrophica bacterium]|nr:M48 family metallopeptidase [Candidatus Omnitrophota bacterium]